MIASPSVAPPPPPPPLELEVHGRPVPKGAVSAFVVPGKSGQRARAVVVQGGSKAKRSALNEWQSAIQDAALVAMGARELEVARFAGTAVAVEVTFRLARPKSHFGTGKNADKLKADAPPYPIGTPDVDKLARSVLDALIGTAFDDDSRVVDLHPRKVYAGAGEVEGARIRIRAASTTAAPVLTIVPSTLRAQGGPGTLGELLGLATCRIEKPDATLYPPLTAKDAAAIVDVKKTAAEPTDPLGEMVAPGRAILDDMDRKDAARDRIRKIIGGSQIEAELGAYGKPSHAIAKHAPAMTASELRLAEANLDGGELVIRPAIDDTVAAAINAGEDRYRVEVLGQESLVDAHRRIVDRGELAREFLECDPRSPRHEELLNALATKDIPRPPATLVTRDAYDLAIDDDFGGADL